MLSEYFLLGDFDSKKKKKKKANRQTFSKKTLSKKKTESDFGDMEN